MYVHFNKFKSLRGVASHHTLSHGLSGVSTKHSVSIGRISLPQMTSCVQFATRIHLVSLCFVRMSTFLAWSPFILYKNTCKKSCLLPSF